MDTMAAQQQSAIILKALFRIFHYTLPKIDDYHTSIAAV